MNLCILYFPSKFVKFFFRGISLVCFEWDKYTLVVWIDKYE